MSRSARPSLGSVASAAEADPRQDVRKKCHSKVALLLSKFELTFKPKAFFLMIAKFSNVGGAVCDEPPPGE